MTVLDAIIQSLSRAGEYNPDDQVAPAVIVWPDKEHQWEPVLPVLRERLPRLLTLGGSAEKEQTRLRQSVQEEMAAFRAELKRNLTEHQLGVDRQHRRPKRIARMDKNRVHPRDGPSSRKRTVDLTGLSSSILRTRRISTAQQREPPLPRPTHSTACGWDAKGTVAGRAGRSGSVTSPIESAPTLDR